MTGTKTKLKPITGYGWIFPLPSNPPPSLSLSLPLSYKIAPTARAEAIPVAPTAAAPAIPTAKGLKPTPLSAEALVPRPTAAMAVPSSHLDPIVSPTTAAAALHSSAPKLPRSAAPSGLASAASPRLLKRHIPTKPYLVNERERRRARSEWRRNVRRRRRRRRLTQSRERAS